MNRKQLADQSGGSMVRYEPTHYSAPPSPEEMTSNPLADIWRGRWLVLLVTILFTAGAVAFLKIVPPAFTATAGILVQAPSSANSASAGPVAPGGIPDSFYYTVTSIIQSPVVCDVAARLLKPGASEQEQKDLSHVIQNNLSTDVGKKDTIISIAYTDKTPEEAAKVCAAVTQGYIQYQTLSRSGSRHEMIDAMIKQKKTFDGQLVDLRDEVVAFKKEHPELQFIVNNAATGATTNIESADLMKLADARTAARLALVDAVAAANVAEQVANDPEKLRMLAQSQKFVTPLDNEVVRVQQMLSDAQTRLAFLNQQYPSAHPLVRQNNAMVTELTAKMGELNKQVASSYLAYVRQAKLDAEARVKAIDDEITQVEARAGKLSGVEGEYAKKDAEVQSLVKLIDALDAQIKNLEVQDTTEVPNISVLRPATVVDAVRTPSPVRVLLLAIAMGIVIGSGIALIRERLDQRVRSAEEVAAMLGLPVIGAVPTMKRALTPLARAQAVHWDPMSEVAEAYRAVRTAIHFGQGNGQAKTIVVTSPTPGDGKSTLASNLAITMAQAGRRTLLLDADFRRPVQHKMFEVKDDQGLTSVLAGQETLTTAIQRTVVEGLDLLPAGPLPLNPSELLNGESFLAILEELCQKYDHIVLDCPPVMAVTDARILGAVCDLSVLVLRAGKTTRRGADMARAAMLSVGSRLLGAVVNDVPRGHEHYGYYGNYSYNTTIASPRRRLVDETEGQTNGNGNGNGRRSRRLPSPSGADARS